MIVKIVNKSKFPIPDYKTKGASGIDLFANIDKDVVLKPMERLLIPTGIYLSIPEGYEGQIRARSGLALKYGIGLANGIGTVDSDYRGEIKVILINFGDKEFVIKPGDRIAQLIFVKYEKAEFREVETLDDTERGSGGFGHTGI
ncbi:dUTP diphosphatase [Caloranaerobacter ferrireducens]|uniref:dUTP diphosphatase n=1 Tax=Caloranaerobacter ferrireducens TaxID=1323370 RepID=UPI00084D71A6|nr:dUTP diphosphatase [Caloranaerobacter ferrireducens]